jgi:hexosaminidase
MIQHSARICVLNIFLCGIIMVADGQRSERTSSISIVPRPVKLLPGKGAFQLGERTTIVYNREDGKNDSTVSLLISQLRTVTGYEFTKVPIPRSTGSIVLIVDTTNKNLQKEGYELRVTPGEIRITGLDHAGLFYGIQTLFQLLPTEINGSQIVHGMTWTVPCVRIVDYPRFSWRGMHLDVGRHFFPVSFIKRYLDLLSMYKLNVFHWHLTEDQGWRIEIKKYPRLTQVGAWRKETMGDGVPYGGFYTQDEIREVVAYAKQRHIEIVPEIEMPGHAKAALAAYPEFSCRQVPIDVGMKWGVEKEVYCPGNDSTFTFLENILSEVFDLFPGKYVHIGGDECPKDMWRECPKCQARIKAEGLKDEQELQSYFVMRIERFINSHGKRMIGWDEILEGGLAPNATVMSWRGTQGGIDAAKSGHDVVMTPTSNCYFDYSQSLTGELDSTRAFLPIDSVYDYEPQPQELSADEAKHVLGSQGNVWTEWMPDSRRVEYMVLPRMCALSEMVWTQKDQRKYDDFQQRMESQYDRLACFGVNFRIPTPFTLGGDIMSFGDTTISFDKMSSQAKAYYTLDGTEPTQNATRYTTPIHLKKSVILKAKEYLPGGKGSNTVWINFSKLDAATNGLAYAYSQLGTDSGASPAQWTGGKSGIGYAVSLPEEPTTPGPFAVRFSGFVTIERAGLYTFYLRADSGSVLAVNKVELINGGLPDARWWQNGKIFLKEGKYPISILDLEFDEWRGVSLEFEGPGIERQSVPSRLFTRR